MTEPSVAEGDESLSEDAVKLRLAAYLRSHGWNPIVAWGGTTGIDIDAKRGTERWIIEVKGEGSRPQMRVNYFLSALGELLQRMDDPGAKYSLAVPYHRQFQRLWHGLPGMAKSRTMITALFIEKDGNVTEVA